METCCCFARSLSPFGGNSFNGSDSLRSGRLPGRPDGYILRLKYGEDGEGLKDFF